MMSIADSFKGKYSVFIAGSKEECFTLKPEKLLAQIYKRFTTTVYSPKRKYRLTPTHFNSAKMMSLG